MSKLKSFVHLLDETGVNHAFGPGDDVPDWAAKKIVNPDAWDSAPTFPVETVIEPAAAPAEEPEGAPVEKPAARRRTRKAAVEAAD